MEEEQEKQKREKRWHAETEKNSETKGDAMRTERRMDGWMDGNGKSGSAGEGTVWVSEKDIWLDSRSSFISPCSVPIPWSASRCSSRYRRSCALPRDIRILMGGWTRNCTSGSWKYEERDSGSAKLMQIKTPPTTSTLGSRKIQRRAEQEEGKGNRKERNEYDDCDAGSAKLMQGRTNDQHPLRKAERRKEKENKSKGRTEK